MKINLFTLGDSTDPNTWSNLPYYLYKHLRARQIEVRPINLIPSQDLSFRAFELLMTLRGRTWRRFSYEYTYDLLRAKSFRAFVNHRLRDVAQQNNDVDFNLFLTFSFSSYPYVGVPVVHYCDRTYGQYLEENARNPTPRDRGFIQIDQQNVENADLVLSTNQPCCDFITSRYSPKRALCLRPGISTDAAVSDPERLIAAKENSTHLLFIGRGARKRGADILVRAFKLFNDRYGGRFTLHIVGVLPDELPNELRRFDHIRFHGYLDRCVPAELERYNNLLRSAKLFVMPMRPGPFPGAISEAQLHCIPVIASNVPGMSEALAHEHDSILVDTLDPHDFADQIDRLVRDVGMWRQMARNSYAARRHSTWTNTVEVLLETLRDSDLIARGRESSVRSDDRGRIGAQA